MSLPPAAAALATQPDLQRLWQAAHRRLEATGGDLEGTSAVLAGPSPAERQTVDRLLGARSRGRALRVRLALLDELLAARAGASLAEIVAVAVGPVRDRPAERAAVVAAAETMWSAAARHRAVGRHPSLADWFDPLRRSGRLRRLDNPERRLGGALDVLATLPSPEPVARARLAAMILGDSHSLDDDQPEGRLVISALAHLAGDGAPTDTAGRRQLWEGAGVTLDDLSSSVLTLGLRPLPRGPLTEAAARWASAGVPLPIPLAAVRAEPWEVPQGTPVRACENPTVIVAAAARFGAACPPLVCVAGNPSLAARRLLGALLANGADVAYHGDFGAGGLAIGNAIIGELGARPWRFRATDHHEALASLKSAPRSCPPLPGRVPAAKWDEDLAPALVACGFELQEEAVLEVLLADLAIG